MNILRHAFHCFQKFQTQCFALLFFSCMMQSASALDISTYHPYAPGSQWSYVNNNFATATVTIGSPVLLPSGVLAIPATQIDSSVAGYSTTYSTIGAAGFIRYQEFVSSVPVTGYGNTSATATYSPALVFAPLNVTLGSTYTAAGTTSMVYANVATVVLSYSSSSQFVGFEPVTNYAGTQTWSALKVIQSVTFSGTVNGQFITQTSSATSWFVDGLGSVQIYKPNAAGIMETWKLTSTNVTPPLLSQTIGVISLVNPALSAGASTTVSATATSALPVVFTSNTPGVCSVAGNVITGISAGTCIIAANQAGDATYSAAPQSSQSFTVAAQPVPVVRFSSPGMTFTGQSVGVSSAVQTVTLTNAGAVSLMISGVAANGDFTQSNNCGLSVPAGASCTLSVTAVPTVAGVRTGTVTVSGNMLNGSSVIGLVALPAGMLYGASGWDLLGNSVNAPLQVATSELSNAANISTVWKWVAATAKWAFYTPSLPDGGAAYAASKGYDFLTVINGGEGFWVNAKAAFSVQLPAGGTAVPTSQFQNQPMLLAGLPMGWSLISVGDGPTASAFNQNLSVVPPATGTIPANITTLWAWDNATAYWYFYAPSLDSSGGLAAYITTKGYLNFGTKVLDPTMGFWVNRP